MNSPFPHGFGQPLAIMTWSDGLSTAQREILEGANFCTNGRRAFRINFRILIFVCLRARVMPHPLVSHRFVGVLNCCRANVCGQWSTRVWKGVRRLEVPVQRHHSIYVSTWEIASSKFQMQKFSQFLFLYGEASYEICENLHRSKISCCMVLVNFSSKFNSTLYVQYGPACTAVVHFANDQFQLSNYSL